MTAPTITWLPAGHLLGARYRIEAPLGSGGFGQVYRAVQLPLERPVAVKVLPPEALGSPERLARFEREAELAQRLEHPNTVRTLDYGVSGDGTPFLVMELLRGESLAAVVEREGPQPVARVLIIASHVLKSLMEAHALGIVHRDVKPPNIFLTSHAGEQVFVKLLDFGVAKRVGADAPLSLRSGQPTASAGASAAVTHASQVMGTPRYMAPEQVAGEEVGPTADLYALGLTLAEALTGRPVFDQEDAIAICLAHMSADPVPLSDEVLASPLGAIVKRAPEKSATERFASAEGMLLAIEAVRERAATAPVAPVGASPREPALERSAELAPTQATPPMSRRVASAASDSIDVAAETERAPATYARHAVARWKVLGGALAALGLGAGVVIGVASRRPGTEASASAETTASEAAPSARGFASTTAEAHAPPPLASSGTRTGVPWVYPHAADTFAVPRSGKLRTDIFDRWPAAAKSAGLEVGDVATSSSKLARSVVAPLKSKTCVGNLQLTRYTDPNDLREYAPNLREIYEGRVTAIVDGGTLLVIALKARTADAARACTENLERGLVRAK